MTKTKRILISLLERIEKTEKEISALKEQINMLGIRSGEVPSFNEIVDEWTNGAKK